MRRAPPSARGLVLLACTLALMTACPTGAAAEPRIPLPGVKLMPRVTLPGSPQAEERIDLGLMDPPAPPYVDSNSPSFWDGSTFVQIHSAGAPVVSAGASAESFTATRRAFFASATSVDPQLIDTDITVGTRRVRGGFWIESVHRGEGGALYGYYHYETTAAICRGTDLRAPFIGAAVSYSDGLAWQDLGLILAAPTNTLDCGSPNEYFAGGVGDFTVVPDGKHLYFLFSSYSGPVSEQGVAVARLGLEHVADPVGHVTKWSDGRFASAGLGGDSTPVLPAAASWHGPAPDAFWGPSVHWNTHMRRYVMLLNRAVDPDWTQGGIYVSFNRRLSDPEGWSRPRLLLDAASVGGAFYPQVIGTDLPGEGTDSRAGRKPRLFVHGVSEHRLRFERRG